jgi:hypothetical protein
LMRFAYQPGDGNRRTRTDMAMTASLCPFTQSCLAVVIRKTMLKLPPLGWRPPDRSWNLSKKLQNPSKSVAAMRCLYG